MTSPTVNHNIWLEVLDFTKREMTDFNVTQSYVATAS